MYYLTANVSKIISMDNKFKIKKIETTNKTFRLPIELVQRLQVVAQNQGVSLNNLIVQCCEYALDNLEK